MKIELAKSYHNGSLLVSFATQTKSGKESVIKLNDSQLEKRLKAAIENKELSGSECEGTLFRNFDFQGYRHVLVIGLGEHPSHEIFRQAAATAQSYISSTKSFDVSVLFDGVVGEKKHGIENLKSFAEGLYLSAYSFDELKSKKSDSGKKSPTIHFITKLQSDAQSKKALQEAAVLGECVNFSRRLGDLPGNLMTPSILADEINAATKGTGIKATIWDKARIKKEKMGGLYGVSQGSDQEPRFIILEYKGAASTKKPFVLVGKGLTFDCGGISIKPSAAMEEMKYDMCGGANVAGAMLAIAKLKLKINAICLIPATENLVNGSATKPGDVHTARNGKTFEINNTDAEGRLILADALCYATEQKPEVIIDAATLTGAMAVALGNVHTGYFTKNTDLKKKIEAAAEASGEWVWHMPLTHHHSKDMKGTYADLSNMSSGKGAGSATAAAFLENFVGEGIPWAHFDIAGTAWAVGNRLPYCPKKGASGVMIRTFVELAKQFSA